MSEKKCIDVSSLITDHSILFQIVLIRIVLMSEKMG